MELILVLSGLAFISLSFILSSRQQRDFVRIHEKMMESVVDAGVVELQSLVSELTGELAAYSQELSAELEAKAHSLQLVEKPAQSSTPADGAAVYHEDVPEAVAQTPEPALETVAISAKPGTAANGWSERERLVREMYNLGMDADAIAKELGIGKGEVRLILDLARHEGPRL